MTALHDSPHSLTDYLWHWESTSPDRIFASDGTGASLTYAETADAVRALSAEFARRGVVPGDRAAILAENSAAWITAFLAGVASGLIVVPLATRLTQDELEMLLNDADPAVIAVDDASARPCR